MGSFDGIDVGAIVAACTERSTRKKPSRPRRGLAEIRAFLDGIPDGAAVFSKEIAEAIWSHADRATIWPKVQSVDGLAKVVGDLLGKGGLNLERTKQGAFIVRKASPELDAVAELAVCTN